MLPFATVMVDVPLSIIWTRRSGSAESSGRPVVHYLGFALLGDLVVEEFHDLVAPAEHSLDLPIADVRLERFQHGGVQSSKLGKKLPVAEHQVLLVLQGV